MAGIPGGGVTEAQFVAADAAQLTQQGLAPAQVESTLIASGTEPLMAADAAQLAAQGVSAPTIAQNLGPAYTAPTTGAPVIDRAPDWTNPNPTPDKTLGEALADYGKAQVESALSNPLGTLNTLSGAAGLAGAVLGGQQPAQQRISYGPIDPTVFGAVTTPTLPGLNPGYFTQVPEQYATTSPVQARFNWQARAPQTGATFSPQQYQAVPGPAVPFGLRAMYQPQAETIPTLLRGVSAAASRAPYNIPQAPLI
jgi:hypothetical protein